MSGFLDPIRLARDCTGGLWRAVEVIASTGSTNADVAERSRAGEPPGLVLVATHQSAGRGRLARHWESPPDASVACSVLVAPVRPLAEWGWLPLLVGLAVVDGVRSATGLDVRLKWPNDVLVSGRKLCGILCEATGDAEAPRAVLGFGMNIALTADDLPVATATSLLVEGSTASATSVMTAILRALESWFCFWDGGGDIVGAYRERCDTLGREVNVHVLGAPTISGRAVDVDSDGGIVIDDGTGPRSFVAGDVEHLRRA